jgi:hypothetical protein
MKPIKEFVNIVGITYGRLDFTKQWLNAIYDTAGKYPFKVTVVNNFHPTENEENETWLKEQYNAGAIHNLCLMTKNVGVAKAANAGWLKEPQAKYYIKLDNDMVARKQGWLDDLVNVAEMNPNGLGSLGFTVEPTSYPVNAEIGDYKLRIKQGNLGGACLFIPKSTEDVVGNFLEIFDVYGEEDAMYNVSLSFARKWNAYLEDEDAFFHLPMGKAAVIDTSQSGYIAKDGGEEIMHKEYRAFKDSFREKNVPKLFARIEALREGRVPLKVISNADKDFKYKWYKGEKKSMQSV